MKKLILTLFAAATVFVACDKDDNQSADNSFTIENEVAVDMSEVTDILNGLGFTGADVQGKDGEASSARTSGESTAANCIDNRPDVPAGMTAIDFQYLPIDASSGYFVTRGGGDTPLLLNRPIVRFLIGTSSEDVQLQLLNAGAVIPLGTTGYSPVFPILAADGYFTLDRTDLYLDSLTGGSGVTPAAAGLACAAGTPDVSSYYEVVPAPFPLTGFLAHILSGQEGNFTGSSANYAGTDRDEVIREIERDINDGQ